ncbi:MAG: hypothetical protein WKF87_20785 [Chryseolinea sp.]
MNIQLKYNYTNEDNIGVSGVAMFSNPDELSSEYIEAFLRQHLIAGRYFIIAEWVPLSLSLTEHDGLVELEFIDETNSKHPAGCINDLLAFLTGQHGASVDAGISEYGARKAA